MKTSHLPVADRPSAAPRRLLGLRRRVAGLGVALAALAALTGCATLPPPVATADPAGPAAGLDSAPAAAAAVVRSAPVGVAASAPASVPASAPARPAAPSTPVAATVPVAAAAASPPAALPQPAALEPGSAAELGTEALNELLPPATKDLWDRIRAGRGIPELDDSWVEQRERYYSTRPDYVLRMVDRGSRYLFHIVEEVERRRMPTELALLPFIESAFNPQAMSSAKASGMWQFIPSTGRYFDLKQNLFRDDRRSVVAATNAALDYLTRLYGMFGDWHLALAAYNWGEGNVQRAIERNRRAGRPTDYASLQMPRETRDYVPKLQAIENILTQPEQFGLRVPSVPNQAVFTAVPIERDMDVELAARLAGLRLEEFKALNPQMNKPVILAAGTPEILLPKDNALQFLARLGAHSGPLASWTAWTAPSTMRVAEAARHVGMTEDDLREANRIPPRMLVRAGSTLLVARSEHKHTDVPESVADNAMMSLAPDVPPMRRATFKARSGDTLASFARRHRVSVSDVMAWNRLSGQARLRAGQSLVVMVPNRAATRANARANARPAAAARGPARSSQASAAPRNRSSASGQARKAPTRQAAPARKPSRPAAERR